MFKIIQKNICPNIKIISVPIWKLYMYKHNTFIWKNWCKDSLQLLNLINDFAISLLNANCWLKHNNLFTFHLFMRTEIFLAILLFAGLFLLAGHASCYHGADAAGCHDSCSVHTAASACLPYNCCHRHKLESIEKLWISARQLFTPARPTGARAGNWEALGSRDSGHSTKNFSIIWE